MGTKRNAAIIGCGGIYPAHAQAIAQLSDVRLAAVADSKPERAQAAAAAYACDAYTDWRALLARPDIDCVHICTPHYLHAPMSIAALQAGKAVLCEKPMATTVADARAMIAADQAAGGGRLGIIFQNRYNSASRMLRDIVMSGREGALVAIRGSVVWQRTQAYYSDDWHGKKQLEGGGVLVNQAIHTLDLLQWIGGGVYSVAGSATCDRLRGVIDTEDTAHLFLRLRSGATGVFYATVAWGADAPVELEIMLEHARYLMRGDRLYRLQGSAIEPVCTPEAHPPLLKQCYGSGHFEQVADFYRSLAAGEAPAIDGEQAIEAVRIFCALYEATAANREVIL